MRNLGKPGVVAKYCKELTILTGHTFCGSASRRNCRATLHGLRIVRYLIPYAANCALRSWTFVTMADFGYVYRQPNDALRHVAYMNRDVCFKSDFAEKNALCRGGFRILATATATETTSRKGERVNYGFSVPAI